MRSLKAWSLTNCPNVGPPGTSGLPGTPIEALIAGPDADAQPEVGRVMDDSGATSKVPSTIYPFDEDEDGSVISDLTESTAAMSELQF